MATKLKKEEEKVEVDGCIAEVHVGLTFQMGPISSNQFGRVDITLRDIKAAPVGSTPAEATEFVDAQVKGGIAASRRAFAYTVRELDQQVGKILGVKEKKE